METVDLFENGLLQGQRVLRGTVDAVVGDTRLSVRVAADGQPPRWCDVLVTGADAPALAPGDEVLAWLPSSEEERGVILGRIGAPRAAAPEPARGSPDQESTEHATPDELVIEAKQALTLRVGDGSITIRADGRILIKGSDLVSHARRTNRIRGGSVAIN